ncbi:uncharacterized protein LOC111627742 isoform X2 [Centruroides sculpturatus]|uniref:uncharacterized protein LOC111627742 isoform X2 n=1 Tax=Centruroides sculpturatus TaxID=218467 RepID=UPI000C6EBFAA|nr:uncharacterized protein LOC111627742 isoform X2 [Centruroides sculpturatus]
MTNREPFNHCTRRYYRSKYQSYHRDSVGENKDVGYKLLGWYIKSSTGMLHHRRRYISDKEALYRNVINSLSKNEENELSSIRERIATLFNNQLYSDVVLNINEKKLFGHSFVLSLASPVFKATFYDELNFARKDSFDVLDVTENGFMNLLRCIQWIIKSGKTNLDEILKTKGPEYLNRNYVVCFDYFTEKDFRKKNLLSQGIGPGAVSSLFIYNAKQTMMRSIPKKRKLEPSNIEMSLDVETVATAAQENSNKPSSTKNIRNLAKKFINSQKQLSKYKLLTRNLKTKLWKLQKE